MLGKIRNDLNNGRVGLKALPGVALPCLLAGFLMSAGLHRTPPVAAESLANNLPSASEQPLMSSPFAPLVAKLTPAVVNVKVSKVEKAAFPWPQMQGRSFGDFPFGDSFNHPQLPQNRTVQGAGSGVIIAADGTILTNNHVVEGAKEVAVTLADQREFKARIVGRDPKTDLAVLKIDAGKDLPVASLGDSNQLKVGDWVLAIGNPFGLDHTVTAGIVSAKGRVIGAGPYDDFIQTDASINPGNSGGPLFNMKGEVVGINTAILPNGQGIGFAIPVNTAKPLIPQLLAKGEVTRGYLGVNIQSITPDLAAALQLKERKGALVADVVSGGPAAKAGIRRGDVIVVFEGKPVQDSHDLPAMVAATAVDTEVTLTVVRAGQEQQVTATTARLPSDGTSAEETPQAARGKWGLQLDDVNPQVARKLGIKADHGVVVVGVQPGSPADEASIQPGEMILEVNRQPVKSVKEVKEQVAQSGDKGPLLLLVQGEQGSRYILLKG
jgi:serine protease Do